MKLNHLLIPYLALLAFMFGGILTSGTLSWYRSLVLPSFHPSEGVIAFVWALIYVCAAWAVLIVWNLPHRNKRVRAFMAGLVLATGLNFLWSMVFFHAHLFLWSVVVALVLGVFVALLAVLIYPLSKKAALLLVPYVLWVFFAAYLNFATMLLNG